MKNSHACYIFNLTSNISVMLFWHFEGKFVIYSTVTAMFRSLAFSLERKRITFLAISTQDPGEIHPLYTLIFTH